ncbi:hypothetical protein LV779_05830 [Streptomyces thinghirensis]|nr:hypothetical protein [Streptomyces thinghirensis]
MNTDNPHAVAGVADLAHAGDLHSPPAHEPATAYPDGVNVEFVVDRAPATVTMRATSAAPGRPVPAARRVRRRRRHRPQGRRRPGGHRHTRRSHTVDEPGGTLVITEHDGEIAEVTGPAVIVTATEEFDSRMAGGIARLNHDGEPGSPRRRVRRRALGPSLEWVIRSRSARRRSAARDGLDA